jgi:hypothetical protein
VAATSLLVQNGLLSLASIGMALMFWFNWTVCLNVVVFGVLTVFIIILTSGANLATVANTISIEKDWIVVIADGNVDALAGKRLRVVLLGLWKLWSNHNP